MIADRLLTASLALTLAASANAQTHVYVDDDAPAGGNGLSWQSAFNDLHDAIELAKNLGQNRGEIRIAGGTYDAGSDPFEVPLAVPGVKPMRVLGGYAGLAFTPNPNLRDTDKYATYLDADFATNIVVLTSAVVLSPGAFVRPAYLAPTSATTLDGLRFRNTFNVAVYNTDRFVSARINDCSFIGIRSGYAAAAQFADLDLSVERSLFASNSSYYSLTGGALLIRGGFTSIRGCDFISNDSRNRSGGAISYIGGDHTISGCYFIGNTTTEHGGAIAAEVASIAIARSEFLENSAGNSRWGGAAYIKTTGTTTQSTVNDCYLADNDAPLGAAIFVDNQSGPAQAFSIDNSQFQRNEASDNGGAIYIPSYSSSVLVERSDFIENRARNGGAVHGRAAIRNSLFEENIAYSHGGAVYGLGGGNVDQCDFMNNIASNDGGALHSVSAVSHSNLIENRAGRNGGGTFAVSAITLTNFTGNYAGQDGAAVFGAGRLVSVTAIGNQAGGNGSTISGVSELEDSVVNGNQGHGVRGPIRIIHRSEISENEGDGVRCGLLSSNPELEIVSSEINGNTELGMRLSADTTGALVYMEDVSVTDNGATGIEMISTREMHVDAHRVTVAGNGWDTFSIAQGNPSQRTSLSLHDSLLHSVSRPALDIPSRVDVLMVGVTAISEEDSAVLATIDSTLQVESSVLLKGNRLSTVVFVGTDLVLIQSLIEGGIGAVLSPTTQPKIVGELLGSDPGFVSPGGIDGDQSTWKDNDYRPGPGSILIDNGSSLGSIIGRDLDLAGVSRIIDDAGMPNDGFGINRVIDIGAYEFQGTTCAPDVNNDGSVDQRDFTAWIAAYNDMSRRADQNFDGSVTPTDYTAWIAAYFVGCP